MAKSTKTVDTTADEAVEVVAQEAKPAVKLPKTHDRPSRPEDPFVNSSFAQRAKAAGRNKRVAESDSK